MSAYQPTPNKNFEKVQNTIKRVGVALGVVTAIVIYFMTKSGWLAFFGFILVAKFVGGELPQVIYHKKKLRRTIFYLSYTLFAILILYFVNRWWGKMWLGVILGLVGGLILNVIVGTLFFSEDIYTEDKDKQQTEWQWRIEKLLEDNPDAVAMKDRFSASEWEAIKSFPQMMLVLVTLSNLKGKSKANQAAINYYADSITKPEKYQEPLLRMMLMDASIEVSAAAGQMDHLALLLNGSLGKELDKRSGQGFSLSMDGITSVIPPESMLIIKNNLNPDEFRNFIKALFEYTLQMASKAGAQDPEQFKMYIEFFGSFAESKQDLVAFIDGARWK